jgi:hypothetical protein
MVEARTYYDYGYNNGLAWSFIREQIGQGLRERYEVPKDLPPKLLTLVSKLDDSDWLFPAVSWQNDRDFFP